MKTKIEIEITNPGFLLGKITTLVADHNAENCDVTPDSLFELLAHEQLDYVTKHPDREYELQFGYHFGRFEIYENGAWTENTIADYVITWHECFTPLNLPNNLETALFAVPPSLWNRMYFLYGVGLKPHYVGAHMFDYMTRILPTIMPFTREEENFEPLIFPA